MKKFNNVGVCNGMEPFKGEVIVFDTEELEFLMYMPEL